MPGMGVGVVRENGELVFNGDRTSVLEGEKFRRWVLVWEINVLI